MLHGRDAERSTMAALVDGARAGRSGVLVVRGQAGVGKSALLADAAERAAGMRVLQARGIESESELAFAALHQLLRPVMGWIGRLPPPQAAALRVAFGLQEGVGADRFLVSVAVLSLLAEAAEDRPVLAVVDDAHWLDGASANALAFAARRLEAEPVALLLAAREEESGRLEGFGGLSELKLGGLDPAAAGALLAERTGPTVAPAVRDRLVEQTGGNPLALMELPSILTPGQLAGDEPLPVPLPLTEAVEKTFLQRARRLPTETQTLLLVAAAEETGWLATSLAAARTLGVGAPALDAAEQAGLVRVRGDKVDFRHPLVRTAVYQGATTAQRQRAHRALAQVLDAAADADRRAWHRAAAAVTPDEAVVDELDRAAERARARGGFSTACAALERAARLTAEPEPRARRLAAAADNAWSAGQLRQAAELLGVARSLTADPLLRADVDRLRGWIEFTAGSTLTARQLLLQAAGDVAPIDAQRALDMLVAAAEAAWVTSDHDAGAEVARLAGRLPPGDDPRTRFFTTLLAGFTLLFQADRPAAVGALREAVQLAEALGENDLLGHADHAAVAIGDDAAAYRLNTQVVASARATGAVGVVVFALQRLAFAELLTGRWPAGAASAAEALRLARETGQPELCAVSLAWLTVLAALRGEEEQLGSLVAETEAVAATQPLGVHESHVHDAVRWARGIQEAAAGQPASALAWFESMSHPVVAGSAAGLDRVEAAIRADRPRMALEWLQPVQRLAQADVPWARARVAHCRALLADDGTAEQHFQQALAHHQRAQRPFERARTELAYGEFLRRARRRVDARAHLAAALQTFEQLGAGPWAERARLELRASGQTARRRDPSTALALTPQELQVARFVAQGLPTREVAAQLFLSPRTIDFHLRNVFAKLGIRSRTELARIPLG